MTEYQLDSQIAAYVNLSNARQKVAAHEQLLLLLADEDFAYATFVAVENNKPTMCINVNDLWYPAVDAESFDINQVWEITDMWVKYAYDGLAAWVGVKRGLPPGSSRYKDPRDVGDDYVEAWYYAAENGYAMEKIK